ncbi:MAG TPA: HIT domain-containing protein [Epsilonproteobacteria bacterium]|nr:HIT domain-containing protein [Campylobacterota bacterium]
MPAAKPFWKNEVLKIEIEESEIPWLKIFTRGVYREMSEVPLDIRVEIYTLLDLIEREMLSYYKPTKINIASFGNYMPHVHWHIMARFEKDSHYPEPMWGTKQREVKLSLPSFTLFLEQLYPLLPPEKQLPD